MLTLKAPAKINWTLAVLAKRIDGYHDIQSLMQTISLYDSLAFAKSRHLRVVSSLTIPNERNLVYRAAQALRAETACSLGATITLSKDIPTGAGLGGGSSDAAATLKGLNQLWQLGLSVGELAEIGAAIGSDVPFLEVCVAACLSSFRGVDGMGIFCTG
ncbi:MAG: 4-diphosphocytidyl-2-C-methyl-D-erythritol kinase [Nitrospirae bacterium]|nr:MAG: 4-diphosphocytidyl-2-C-methyl-D-erythritol kinase [Nitrospirota bacterium]